MSGPAGANASPGELNEPPVRASSPSEDPASPQGEAPSSPRGEPAPLSAGSLALVAEAEKRLAGQPLTREQADAEAAHLSERLRAQGLPVAIALVTPEAWAHFVQDGELRFRVFEGTLGQVRVGRHGADSANTSRVRDARLIATAEQALCGPAGLPCTLTSAGLERAQLRLQDLPGVHLDGVTLSPEGVGVGQTALEISASPADPLVKGSLAVDNYGSPATGHARLGANLVFTNLLHQSDVFQLGLLQTKDQTNGSVGLSLPWGEQGWRAKLNAQKSSYSLNAVDSKATSDAVQASLMDPLVRGLGQDWSFELGGYDLSSRQSVAGQPAFAPRFLDGARESLYGDSGERSKLPTLDYWSLNATLTEGHVRQSMSGLDPSGVLGSYGKLAGGVLARRTLSDPDWYVLASLRGQLPSRNLDSSERMAVGGVDGVRAFRSDEGQLDEGVLASLELHRRFALANADQFVPGLFIDALKGRIVDRPYAGWQTAAGYANSNLSDARSVAGWGLSADWATHQGLSASLSLAWKLPGSPDSINYPGSAKARVLAILGWNP